MGIVIIILLIVVIIVLVSGKKKDDSGSEDGASSSSSSQSSEDSSGDSGDGSSDSITDVSKVADDSTSSDSKSDSEKETTKVEKLSKGLYLAYSVGNTWEDGDKKMSGLALNIVNNTDSDIKNWTLVLEVEGLKSCSGWCGNFTTSGNTLKFPTLPTTAR